MEIRRWQDFLGKLSGITLTNGFRPGQDRTEEIASLDELRTEIAKQSKSIFQAHRETWEDLIVKQIDQFHEDVRLDSNALDSALQRTATRLYTLFFGGGPALSDPLMDRGRKSVRDSRRGHEKVWGDQATRAKIWSEWQAFVDAEHAKYPNLTWNALSKCAADHFKVSQRIIKERAKNPRK